MAITGQVERRLIGTDAFQEADMKGATAPFCKHNYLVEDASLLPQVFAEAFYIAKTGRPGPVLIDIPVDVQLAEFTYQPYELKTLRGYHPVTMPDKGALLQAAEAISGAKRPLLVAGGGVIGAGAQEKLAVFAKKWDIPVVTTLMGVGAMCYADELCLGILGSHGTPGANQAVSKADALVLCGCRVNERTIGNAAKIAQNAAIIHFDIDRPSLAKTYAPAIRWWATWAKF